ncbi:SAM-dependent methyltransferase [Heliorestis acidaminivorans]|uniref:SAM-dependent methyltransferase n=1 Tax=Heliorestis acidaminivorans TaxID=553427 RepID=A0A6I0F6Y5_9FIRM|nr:class I SAM-dependent methyltransferase [Heliorestis acidaminivorans]KAB2954577.1 SAM-dependent methyltransferase [Heliorestis acidaminivorans]
MDLSPRLARLAEAVPADTVLADVGTDHAYLPVALVKAGKIDRAIATDVHQGPAEAARQHVKAYGVDSKIKVRLGDGLKPIKAGEVETLVIAGMGGGTILKILQEGVQADKVDQLKRMVLQPLEGATELRKWLLQRGWKIIEEDLIEEGKRIYEVIVLEQSFLEQDIKEGFEKENRTKSTKLSMKEFAIDESIQWLLGPRLLEKKHKLLIPMIEKHIIKEQRALSGMQAGRNVAKHALEAKEKRINDLEEVKKWLLPAEE